MIWLKTRFYRVLLFNVEFPYFPLWGLLTGANGYQDSQFLTMPGRCLSRGPATARLAASRPAFEQMGRISHSNGPGRTTKGPDRQKKIAR